MAARSGATDRRDGHSDPIMGHDRGSIGDVPMVQRLRGCQCSCHDVMGTAWDAWPWFVALVLVIALVIGIMLLA
jgi:hypothetical protein